MADDRLPCCRSESIAATRSDKVMSRPLAISLRPLQNASSRLTLVLWPAMTMERLTTGDFIARLPFRSGGGRGRGGFGVALGFEFALGLAASMPQPIGRCRSLSELPLGLLARPTKVNDLAHPALDEPLRGDAGPSHVASGPNTPIPWRRVRAGAPAGRGI